MKDIRIEDDIARDSHPALSIIHPNGRGTGRAMKMRLFPAHESRAGYIVLSIAKQNGCRMEFDWETQADIRLTFDDLSKMLQVFRGELEYSSIIHSQRNYDGDICTSSVSVKHDVDSYCGYTVSLKTPDTDSEYAILLNHGEALGVSIAIEHSLGLVVFGIPMEIPHA